MIAARSAPGFIALALILVVVTPTRAAAWDNKTHRLITRLAIEGLPPSTLKDSMLANEASVEQHTEDPDTVLRRRFGRAEERHHFIDLEYFGADPFAALSPDLSVNSRLLRKSGSLPWTIVRVSDDLARAWQRADCAEVMRDSGYLAHYVGDATQPLHTTKYYDGYAGHAGVHARFEKAADRDVAVIERPAADLVHLQAVDSPWPAAIAEIRDSHAHVDEVIDADREARRAASGGGAYARALLAREESLITRQVAQAASTLASLWLLEWKRAGSPSLCTQRTRASEPHWNRLAPQS